MNIQVINNSHSSYNSTNKRVVFKAAAPIGGFKKGYRILTDTIARGEGKLADSKPVQDFIDFIKHKNYQQHIPAGISLVISGSYVYNTLKSKTIEKDQKMPLAVNQTVVAIGSTIGAYTLDNYLNRKLDSFSEVFNMANIKNKDVQNLVLKMHENKDKLEKKDFDEFFKLVTSGKDKTKPYTYKEKIIEDFEVDRGVMKQLKSYLKKNPEDNAVKTVFEKLKAVPKKAEDKAAKMNEIFLKDFEKSTFLKEAFSKNSFKKALSLATENEKNLSKLMKGFKAAKSLMVFAMIYRFATPVIATPIANKISGRIEEKKKAKN